MYENIHLNDPTSDEVVRINGKMRGSIRCKRLFIPKDSEFLGSIIADQIQCHGRIEGTVYALHFFASKTSEVFGSVTANVGCADIRAGANCHANIVTTPLVEEIFKTGRSTASETESAIMETPASVVPTDKITLPESFLKEARILPAEAKNKAKSTFMAPVEVSTTVANNAPIKLNLPFIFD